MIDDRACNFCQGFGSVIVRKNFGKSCCVSRKGVFMSFDFKIKCWDSIVCVYDRGSGINFKESIFQPQSACLISRLDVMKELPCKYSWYVD